jgi:D-inositol-3-phosphate glycosyltransferase
MVAGIHDGVPGPLRLLVVGAGTDRSTRCALEATAARLGIEASVEIRGTVPHEQMPSYYSAADVLAAPSAYESFGMAAVEAMACGTPVVAFQVGGLAETVTHGVSGLLAPPGDREAFRELLKRALRGNEAAKLGRQARMAANRFGWEHVAARTISLYDDLLFRQRFAYVRVSGES